MQKNMGAAKLKDSEYLLFTGPGENVICAADGVLDGTVKGQLVLTDKKLFFYFVSNISRDKKFIATHPYIMSAELKEGLFGSKLTVRNNNQSFQITKLNKKEACSFYKNLIEIINKK